MGNDAEAALEGGFFTGLLVRVRTFGVDGSWWPAQESTGVSASFARCFDRDIDRCTEVSRYSNLCAGVVGRCAAAIAALDI